MKKLLYPISGKLFFKIPLRLQSPVIIGAGEAQHSDVDVLREPGSGKPLLPATSLIGVFRNYLWKIARQQGDKTLENNLRYLLGYQLTPREKNLPENQKPFEAQSALQCDDVTLENARIAIRDNVAIDPQKSTAKEGSKFNYEVVESADGFDLNFEITLRTLATGPENYAPQTCKQLIATVIKGLQDNRIRLGAKTNKGFGRLAVDEKKKTELAALDFANPAHVWQWLVNAPQFDEFAEMDLALAPTHQKFFRIEAAFQIKSALTVRAYSLQPHLPDAISLISAGRPVLPGTSTMGALRHRTYKILRTLAHEPQYEKKCLARLHGLFGFVDEANQFGYVDENNKKVLARKGRLLVEETVIKNVAKEIQTRIKIDRFTGGTIHGALFETMPLWQSGGDAAVKIVITLNGDYAKWEAGLLLFILKDLWTGDLPIGGEKNAGRGVLLGRNAKISWEQGEVEIKAGPDGQLVYDVGRFAPLADLGDELAREINRIKEESSR